MPGRLWLVLLVHCVMVGAVWGGVRVPIEVYPAKGAAASSATWPVTAGVPFARGQVADAAVLSVVDGAGKGVACQVTAIEKWDDGSVRWAWVDFQPQPGQQYALIDGKPTSPPQTIKLVQAEGRITVNTGAAGYVFEKGGCFSGIDLGGQAIVAGSGEGFYVLDSQGRRAVLRAGECKVELNGPMRSVVRVAGDYTTSDAKRVAQAVVYFHFFAGRPEVRIEHKLIVSEDTNALWFREIGLTLPLSAQGPRTATFNKPDASGSESVAFPAEKSPVMVQLAYPHFGHHESRCEIRGADIKGSVAGNWADLSWAACGLAAQIPAFAQTFPKAFALTNDALTVKLWASEANQELDFRTAKVLDWYFGKDWIPADNEAWKQKNNAQGTSRTHDIWLYPHAGALSAPTIATFGAVTEPIFAKADPQWIADSGALGPIHPYDQKRFAEAERAIGEYFDCTVGFAHTLFPNNGYLYYRGYPWSAQGWEVKDGQWYPTIHRLSRNLEYNFKRHVWILAMRSPDRRYFDWARDYTRFQHDMLWSNADTEGKPTRGRLYQGFFHSPIVWAGTGAYLAYASSEDVIQFVYDYFFTGDYHSRDMAEAWIAALKTEYGQDAARAVREQDRSDSLLRMIGSGYELHHDPALYKFSHAFLEQTVKPDKEVGLDLSEGQIAKTGDVYSAYFYNWIHTRDPLALTPLKRFAEFDYRRGKLHFMDRSSAIPYGYALKYFEENDANFAGMLASWMQRYSQSTPTLAQMGIDRNAIKPGYTGPWGQIILTGSSPVFYGLPIAMEAAVRSGVAVVPRPLAEKPHPTQRVYLLLNRTAARDDSLDLFVNNFGDVANLPKLYDAQGKPAAMEVIERNEHRVTKPPGIKGVQAHKEYYMLYESLIFYRLKIPAGVPTGVYHLDAGDQVSFKLLGSTINNVVIAAPDGMVILEGHRYYFPVSSSVGKLTVFSHRPVILRDAAGKELEQKPVDGAAPGSGMFTVDTGGRGGVYSVISTTDKYMHSSVAGSDTFFRLHNAPLLLAMDDPSRLFDIDPTRYPSTEPPNVRTQPKDGLAFVEAGRIGGSVMLGGRVVSVPTDATASNPPHTQGTVEFWWRPHWSAGDFSMADSTQRLYLFHMEPVGLAYFTDNPNSGRTSYYNESWLIMNLFKAGETRAITYPTAGQWCHVALTWRIDGKDSQVDIFTDGRKRSFCHYYDGMLRTTPVSELNPVGDALRLGSARFHGKASGGDEFDELRVSRTIRYMEDFTPPTKAFAPDADTWLLMHFDGDLKALRNGQPVEGVAKSERRLY